MGRVTACCIPAIATAILYGVCWPRVSLGAPPATAKIAQPHGGVASGGISVGGAWVEGFHGSETRATDSGSAHEPLDLRPPTVEFASLFASRTPHDPATFDGPIVAREPRTFTPARRGAAIDDENSLLPHEPTASHPRVMGRAEAFAQRFHREGLPIARLWENHSALVTIGFNSKGKPGLWLVQKTH